MLIIEAATFPHPRLFQQPTEGLGTFREASLLYMGRHGEWMPKAAERFSLSLLLSIAHRRKAAHRIQQAKDQLGIIDDVPAVEWTTWLWKLAF